MLFVEVGSEPVGVESTVATPDTGEDSNKSRQRLVGFYAIIGSSCCLISGLLTVVLVLQYKIVPLISGASLARTECFVIGIHTHSNSSESAYNGTDNYDGAVTGSSCEPTKISDDCVSVNVTFQRHNEQMSSGLLMDYPLQTPAPSTKCAHGQIPRSSLGCPNTSLWLGPRHVTTGQTYHCFVERKSLSHNVTSKDTRRQAWNTIGLQRSTNLKIKLLYILPPTMLFIAGFVGLFFSCVYHQLYK